MASQSELQSSRLDRTWRVLVLVLWYVSATNPCRLHAAPMGEEEMTTPPSLDALQQLIDASCIDCHNASDKSGAVDFESLLSEESLATSLAMHQPFWERVVRQLRTGQMPPADANVPRHDLLPALQSLTKALDQQAVRQVGWSDPPAIRRLTRYEYGNAIRDLLAIDIDEQTLLPADSISHGFDNITVNQLSPTLIQRYLSAAEKISRQALGHPSLTPDGRTIRLRPDITQDEHVAGLPLGTRGGVLTSHFFPQSGQYEFRVRLTRDRNEHVEGLSQPHTLQVLLDDEVVGQFVVKPPKGQPSGGDAYATVTHETVDQNLKVRLEVPAGTHEVGVTFIQKSASLLETKRQPLDVHFNMYRHPRLGPAVYQLSIEGPFQATEIGDTPSRRNIFAGVDLDAMTLHDVAEKALVKLLNKALRKPAGDAEVESIMELYRQGASQGGFEQGMELAISGILVHPQFLLRVERQPANAIPGEAYRISDWELASRLAFFLWSSLPDEQLMENAATGRLADPSVLAAETRRMLADDRAQALVENFASQWLYLRNLEGLTPDARAFPNFDDNLRQAFRQETELFITSVLKEDRSVVDLLQADYTYLNERLALHYGIANVRGSHFRRVRLPESSQRGGLLRQASVLSVTSYATRTSPVLRGKWFLENILGTPPPPPPPNVPDLQETLVSASLPVRQRLEQHRQDPACASCHNSIDPIGFVFEHYDAIGRWRDQEFGVPVDASGKLPGTDTFEGVAGLERALRAQPELFVTTMSEKLLTYALGRGCEPSDATHIRQIVRHAQAEEYRFSALIQGIVQSPLFQMRIAQ